nr:lipase family protein [Deltaproteobacteria bacterium]
GAGPIVVTMPGGTAVIHARVAEYSTDVVQVFQAEHNDGVSLIVSFRGTQFDLTKPGTAIGDLLQDARGATINNATPTNPWTGETMDKGKVGAGFYARANNYMSSAKGHALRDRLLELEGQSLDIHVVGHSLGAIASQLFSFFCAQYLEQQQFDQDTFRLFNFAFNTPRGVNETFHGEFIALANRGWFTPMNLTVNRDPVSEWTLDFSRSNIWSPNDISKKIRNYCPHGAQLPRTDRCGSLDNHWMDEDRIDRWRNPSEANWPTGIAYCMREGYAPLVLRSVAATE